MTKLEEVGYHVTIKDLPCEERPRERLLKLGAEYLSLSELIAIIIRTGTHAQSAVQIAEQLLSVFGGIQPLLKASVEELSRINGIGMAKATQLKAVFELGKRLAATSSGVEMVIRSPESVANLLMQEMRFLEKEHFKAVLLNTKNVVIKVETISIGHLNASLVHPRELYKEAIKHSSAALILAHNHPSGDPSPSNEDLQITKRLCEVGELVGIRVLDHIIFGDNKYISLREKGML